MVSTENGHKSRKKRTTASGSKSRRSVKNQDDTYLNTHYDLPRSVFDGDISRVKVDDHVYDVVRPHDELYANDGAVYQNLSDGECGNLAVQSHYENLNFEEADDHTYLNVEVSRVKKSERKTSRNKQQQSDHSTYDVPRSTVMAIYDHPAGRTTNPSADTSLYDYPKGLIPLSARLLLNARKDAGIAVSEAPADEANRNCDADSLDGDNPSSSEHDNEITSDPRPGSSPDEGIEDLDPRGLCVIVEETEAEENSYSNLVQKKGHSKRKPGKPVINKADRNNKKCPMIETKGQTSDGADSSAPSESDFTSLSSLSNEDDQLSEIKQRKPKGSTKSSLTQQQIDEETERTQRDRCIEVYTETMRQRNSHQAKSKSKIRGLVSVPVTSAKEELSAQSTIRRMKKFLPSVRALRHQFESKSTETKVEETKETSSGPFRKWRSNSGLLEVADTCTESSRSRSSSMGSLDGAASSPPPPVTGSKNMKQNGTSREVGALSRAISTISIIQPTVASCEGDKEIDFDMYRPRHSTAQWNPTSLLEELYHVGEPFSLNPNDSSINGTCVNIEGALDKLPTGRRKATFWNAWKRRYFKAQDGYLHCYQNSQSEKANVILQLQGGRVENMENNMIGIDDGKGHYMVVKGSSTAETERWYQALLTHISHNVHATYVQPWPIPKEPTLLKDVLVLDLGSSSVRAGILSTQATLPQIFFPSVAAVDKTSGNFVAFGSQAVLPEMRAQSTLAYPLRPSNKISKYMMEMEGVSGLIRTAFKHLNVDASNYGVQISIPRHLNQATQTELTRLLFEEFGVKSVNLTHQSILTLLAYDSKSGIVVDIGERIDIVPIMDGYILETSASQVPYGGQQLVDHLRHFLVQQRCSLITDVESYLIRYVLEKLAYVAGPDVGGYTTELNKARNDPSSVRGSVDLHPFSNGHLPWDNVSLELGRFQVTEGLFHPEAWGLDNPGVQKLVHRAIQDCSVDIRKEMVRSIFLSGGVTLLPNFPERLEAEVDRLTPSHLVPKVHASPYRYHASYIGACVLCNSPTYDKSKIRIEDWKRSR